LADAVHAVRAGSSRGGTVAPETLEWPVTLAAIAFLVWQADAFHDPEFTRGAGDRYRQAVELSVPNLPQALGTGRFADSITGSEDDPATLERLTGAYEAFARSLAQPLKARLPRLEVLENRAREARAGTDVQTAIESLNNETRAYRDAYGIPAGATRSIPLDCAWSYFAARQRADGMAAILDGDARRASAALPPETKASAWSRAERGAGCPAVGQPRQAVTTAAEIVAQARSSEINGAKSRGAQELLANAHWIYALWAVTGLALLQIGRQAMPARCFLPLTALVWAAVGWATHVHVEWISDRSVHTSRLLEWGVQWPDFFHVAAAVAAVLLLLGMMIRPAPAAAPPQRQTPSSRLAYAGFVLFVGLGWWLSLDLSATGHAANRFHALYQQVYVFAAFVLLTLLAPLRLKLADRMVRWLGFFLLLARPRGTGVRRYLPWVVYALTAALVLLAASATHRQQTQFTSELFRLWLILGAAWFFFVRGESALALHAGGMKGVMQSVVFASPLLFVLCVPILGLVLTDDFGPLFVMLYAASIFVGTAFAFAFFDRAGYRPWLGGTVGVLVAGAWVYLMTFALYSLPAPLARIAERLASVRSPFTSTNDQMAIITWFQESAPAQGYGFGAVPWCGEMAGATCRGVPKQIQSDYVFTAFAGVYGKAAALALVALLALWLVRVVIHHGRATRGTVALESAALTQQAWLSWIAVCWVGLTLAQLAITVAGNLGWLPLTGITFPFASFGAWSLLANTLLLALAISLPRRA
jgi:cell division protein FtsW (lipid II flippase)